MRRLRSTTSSSSCRAERTWAPHLRVLREAGLVDVQRDAQRRVYSLRHEPLIEVDDWLGRYRVMWERRLDALHAEMARGKREQRSNP
jgi:hypothetical protein